MSQDAIIEVPGLIVSEIADAIDKRIDELKLVRTIAVQDKYEITEHILALGLVRDRLRKVEE